MAPKYTKIIPSLPVSSVPKAVDFYTNSLGFRVAGRDRDDHTWLQLASDQNEDKYNVAVNVYLRRRGFPDLSEDVAFGKIYVRLGEGEGELESLLETFQGKGVVIKNEITTKPWGLKDFTITDLDGNLINFSQAVFGNATPKPAEAK